MLFDLHGYMRMRGDFFHRMNLGLPDVDLSTFEPLDGNKFFSPPVESLEGREDSDVPVANDASCIARLSDAGVSAQRIGNRCHVRH